MEDYRRVRVPLPSAWDPDLSERIPPVFYAQNEPGGCGVVIFCLEERLVALPRCPFLYSRVEGKIFLSFFRALVGVRSEVGASRVEGPEQA